MQVENSSICGGNRPIMPTRSGVYRSLILWLHHHMEILVRLLSMVGAILVLPNEGSGPLSCMEWNKALWTGKEILENTAICCDLEYLEYMEPCGV